MQNDTTADNDVEWIPRQQRLLIHSVTATSAAVCQHQSDGKDSLSSNKYVNVRHIIRELVS